MRKKIWGLPFYPQEYEDFAFCVNSYDIRNMNFKGSPLTRWNGMINNECIFKRLERLLVNQKFLGLFGVVEMEHLSRTGLDNASLFLTCGSISNIYRKTFRLLIV